MVDALVVSGLFHGAKRYWQVGRQTRRHHKNTARSSDNDVLFPIPHSKHPRVSIILSWSHMYATASDPVPP